MVAARLTQLSLRARCMSGEGKEEEVDERGRGGIGGWVVKDKTR